jgi:HIRAN domain
VVSFGVVAQEVFLEGDDLVRVVGVSHYQPAIRAACGAAAATSDQPVRVECRATLVPEPDNPHDPQAIAVHVDGQTVGYLARDEHPRWRDIVETLAGHGRVAACEAMIAGRGAGSETDNLGVFLRLPTPTEARAQVGIALREARE